MVLRFFSNAKAPNLLTAISSYGLYAGCHGVTAHRQAPHCIYPINFIQDDVCYKLNAFRGTDGLFTINKPVAFPTGFQNEIPCTHRVSHEMFSELRSQRVEFPHQSIHLAWPFPSTTCPTTHASCPCLLARSITEPASPLGTINAIPIPRLKTFRISSSETGPSLAI